MSGRANAHTLEAASRRPIEVDGGWEFAERELSSVAALLGGGGPKPPAKEIPPCGMMRFPLSKVSGGRHSALAW